MDDGPRTASGGRHFVIGAKPHDPLLKGLVLLCNLLGRKVSKSDLRDGMPLVGGKLSLIDVPMALRRVDISARTIDIPLADINERLLPALLLLKDGKTVLLVSLEGQTPVTLSPESGGETSLDRKSLEALYSGTAIFAKPKYRPDERAGDYAADQREHWFKGPLKACWPAYLEVGLASMAANLLAIASSLFALQVYDRVVPNNAFETLWVLASGVIVAVVLEFVLRSLRGNLLDITGKRLDLKLSMRLFEQILQLKLSARPQSTGAFGSVVREFETIREFFTSSTAGTISDIPFVIFFIAVIAYIGGPVAWVPVAAIVLMVLPSLLLQGKLAKLSRKNLREGAIKHGVLFESVEQMETMKVTRAEGRNLKIWELLSADMAEHTIKIRRLSILLSYGSAMIQQLCYVGVVIVGVYEISQAHMTVGGLIACSMLASRTVAPMNQVAGILIRWQHVKVAMEGLNNLMNAPIERPHDRKFVQKPQIQGHYQLEGVQFKHTKDGLPVLDIRNLDINAGEKIILMGRNGSGKSTLLRLLAGLNDQTAGNLLLDGVMLNQIDPGDKRRAIGYLPQDAALFYGTLRENLLLDGEGHDDETLLRALDAVALGNAVRKHPLGLDMPIAGNGSVSGGQRQAICLARVLLQDPRIMLLDEPTAAFDQESEAHVVNLLKRYSQGRTLIVATHKRALLSLGQRGLVLKEGKLVMDGPLTDIIAPQSNRSNAPQKVVTPNSPGTPVTPSESKNSREPKQA